MMKVKEGLRYLRNCQTAGPGEAARRIREKREDQRIRAERERKEPLTTEERLEQEAEARKWEICARAVFLAGEAAAEAREAAERSLEEQTCPPAEIEDPKAGYTAFLEPDGLLHPGALYECLKAIQESGADLVYTDEDFFTEAPGDRNEPYYKPDYGPDSLKGCNYMGPFLVCRDRLLQEAEAGNFAALDADGRWDATIRLAEKAKKICHIPKVLYHRKAAGNVMPAIRRVRCRLKACRWYPS